MPILLQIALGGAIGAVLRHLLATSVARLAGYGFPWGTLSVNVVGGFAMGIAAVLLLRRGDPGPAVFAPFVMAGVLGGFTTFSAFTLEVFDLVTRERPGLALAYVLASVGLSLAAFTAGVWTLRGTGAA